MSYVKAYFKTLFELGAGFGISYLILSAFFDSYLAHACIAWTLISAVAGPIGVKLNAK